MGASQCSVTQSAGLCTAAHLCESILGEDSLDFTPCGDRCLSSFIEKDHQGLFSHKRKSWAEKSLEGTLKLRAILSI